MSDFEDLGYLDDRQDQDEDEALDAPTANQNEGEGEERDGGLAAPLQQEQRLEQQKTLPPDVLQLQKAWVGEVCAPELLVYKEDIVERMLRRLTDMQQQVDDYKSEGREQMYTANLYQMELDRIRFAVTKYIRVRVHKIEQDVFYILLNSKDMLNRGQLSDKEFNYTKTYCDTLHEHLNTTVLGHLPEDYQQIGDQVMAEPDMDVFVVCRVLEDLGHVEVAAEQNREVELRRGDEYVVRYRPIRDFVLDGRIELI